MSWKISLSKLCGVVTDGASVMIDSQADVTTQMKDKKSVHFFGFTA